MSSPHNGVVGDRLHSFTALVGVFLTDVSAPWSGNLAVWSGSTDALSAWFAHDRSRLRQGMPDVRLGAPHQLLARAGDAFLANYLLAHAATVNTCARQRRAVFFRLALSDLEDQRWERLVRPWSGWRLSNGPSGIRGGDIRSTR